MYYFFFLTKIGNKWLFSFSFFFFFQEYPTMFQKAHYYHTISYRLKRLPVLRMVHKSFKKGMKHWDECPDWRGSIHFTKGQKRGPKSRDKRPILRGPAELWRAVFEPSCGLIEESIKGADGHCLAFSAGPTFATCIAAPTASRWAS